MAAIRLRWNHGNPPLNIEQWRQAARRRVPDLTWAYVDGGADDLVTVKENMSAFRRWRLRQRVLSGVAKPNLSTVMAKTQVAMPVALAPTGGTGVSHWTGDVASSRAAEAAGTRLCLSTVGAYTLEEVAKATEQNHWFQLYPFGNHLKVGQLMQRARDAGYTALFVTVDVPVMGNREGERMNALLRPWTLTPRRALNMALRPRWVYAAMFRNRLASPHYLEPNPDPDSVDIPEIKRSRGPTGGADAAFRSAETLARFMQADLDWDDLAWMRDIWKGPFYVKGIMDADDAARCVDQLGADGVVVSNHGGRQLDRTLASIDALPAIVDRIGNRAEVYLDGGVRRGTDVITALCLGAKGVFIGRPYVYGLAAAGQKGVASVLEIFRSEIERSLALMGCASVDELDRSWLIASPPTGGSW